MSRFNPTNILAFVFQEERRSGVLLIIAAVLALFLANSAWSNQYFDFLHIKYMLGSVELDLRHWINEGLMALFFLVVALEVKRELVDGELSTWRRASFPVIAAVGGMVLPALIYTYINPNPPLSSGWAIPIATDIAIAVGVLALLGKRIPKNLRLFLLSLAIIDDIGSIMIIGLFYNQPSNMFALMHALILSLSLSVFRKQKLWLLSFGLVGIGIWYCLLLSGISGTMAGVIVALMAPLTKRHNKKSRLQSPEKIEDILLPLTAYLIVPVFVFANAGIVIKNISVTSGDGLTVFLGVVLGLLFGKPLGIFCSTWIATKLRLTYKPNDLRWAHILGVGFVAGIGFTISILITGLTFAEHTAQQNSAIFGVFVASVTSGFIGLNILRKTTLLKKKRR